MESFPHFWRCDRNKAVASACAGHKEHILFEYISQKGIIL
jgi:hypothetical protein